MAPRAYTAFILTFEGQVIRRVDMNCETEDEAKEQARQLVDHNPVELWERPRQVARHVVDSGKARAALFDLDQDQQHEVCRTRPYADPEKAAQRLLEIANTVEPVQDGRIHIEKINGPFLFQDKGSPAEYGAGMKLAIERGWLAMHESGTFVRFTPAGADLFA